MPVPIIVGIGDIRNKSPNVSDAIEPAKLMAQAIQKALSDTGLSASDQKQLLGKADSLHVVPTWTWAYEDLPSTVAQELGINPSNKVMPDHGGDQPALQCDEAARRIASKQSQVAILTGGEALASVAACQKAGEFPPKGWTEQDPEGKALAAMSLSILQESVGTTHNMGLPIHVYPLYENARRAHLKQTAQQNNAESAKMYAEFDAISSKNEYSWNSGRPAQSAEFIGTVSKKNRLICEPYPLLMNAFNTVNLSAACVLTSTDVAESLGIPKDKWIYVLGGAGTHEQESFWERPHFHSSPAITKSIDSALDVSGLRKEQIDCFDFYSCFPIVPKLACDHLGISTTDWKKPISFLGGLTSFGGAGNNYSMHALTAMSRSIRANQHKTGLILANGGMLTHQFAICLSKNPRTDKREYASRNPLPKHYTEEKPPFSEFAEGPAVIETYTIEYERDGSPANGLIVGKLKNGKRFLANHGDDDTLKRLANPSNERIGQSGRVEKSDDGRNLFYFEAQTRL